MTEENQAAGQAEAEDQQFLVQRTYIKDLSLETPMGTDAFLIEQQPEINQDLSTEVNQVAEGLYETVLKLTVTATAGDKTVFLVEIHQAGLFLIKGIEDENLARVLNTVCPNILFPYARETIDSTLVKSTFPPLMLPPINFDALYAQVLEEQQAKAH
jgi:preprotein translocase subunit SecB